MKMGDDVRKRTTRGLIVRGEPSEKGQGLAEYIIIVVIVALLVILAIRYFGGSIFGQFQNATQELNVAGTEGGDYRDRPENMSRESAGGGDSDSRPEGGAGGGGDPAADRGKRGSGDGGGGGDLNSQVEKYRVGVGATDDRVTDGITLSWSAVGQFAAGVVAFGVFIVFRMRKKTAPKTENKRKKRSRPFSKGQESGQAIAEFVLVAITFLFTILGLIQLALVLNAYTMVRYAAYNAARAAIVHHGDEEKMLDAARLSLVATAPSHGRADHPLGFTENFLSQQLTDQIPLFTEFFEPITSVEILDNMERESGETITFDDPRDAGKAIVTVKVKHYYELVIPLVNRIFYFVYRLNRIGPGYQGQSVNQLSAVTDRERRSGSLRDKEFRIPLIAHYTMRMQSDLEVP